MAQVTATAPNGSILYSVTVARALAPLAYRKALAVAWRAKGGALAAVTFL